MRTKTKKMYGKRFRKNGNKIENLKKEREREKTRQQQTQKKKIKRLLMSVFVGSEHRPGFDWHNFATDWHIFLHINWSINIMIPNWRIIGTIDDIDLHFDRTR